MSEPRPSSPPAARLATTRQAVALVERLRRAHTTLLDLPGPDLERAWNDAVAALADRGTVEGRELRDRLAATAGLSAAGLEAGLAILLEGVEASVAREVFRRARPRHQADVLLVVLAATPPLLAVQPLLPCLARRRPTLLKSSSREPFATPLLVEALISREPRLGEAIAAVTWERSAATAEEAVGSAVDSIVVFGGREAAERFARRWPDKTTVQGPRTSVAVLAADALPGAAEKRRRLFDRLADDVALFDQRGCLSLQWLLTDAAVEPVAEELHSALERAASRLPPGPIDPALAARIQARRAECLMAGRRCFELSPAAGTVIVDSEGPLEPSVGARTVTVRSVGSLRDVPALLGRWAGHLQGAVLLGAGAESLVVALRQLGVRHFAAPGELQRVDALWPNGGHDPLELY